jgi:hypothetical protein
MSLKWYLPLKFYDKILHILNSLFLSEQDLCLIHLIYGNFKPLRILGDEYIL